MKHYFISDAHLGSGIIKDSNAHQAKFVNWLNFAAKDANAIYLLGDIFDFWFEFPSAIQTEYNNVLDAIRNITNKGIKVHFYCGNHDQWTFGYLESYCGIIVHRKEDILQIVGRKVFLAHGHGLGKQSIATRLMNGIFECKFAQFLFRHIVPAKWAWAFGKRWSEHNRRKHTEKESRFYSENKENQVIFAKKHSIENPDVNFYIMGHRHIELNLQLATGAQLMILGDFYELFTYASLDEVNGLMMMNYEE